jgi:hypothetical protein
MVATYGSVGIFGYHLGTVNGDQMFFSHLMVIDFGRGFLKVYEFENAIHDSFLSTSVFIWVLCLWLPLTTITWNLGWVEVIKSLVKGYFFHIL